MTTPASTPSTASIGPALISREAALSASDTQAEASAAPVTIFDVLAAQIMTVRDQCDALLTTVDLLRQSARVPTREEEEQAPRATFGGRRSQ